MPILSTGIWQDFSHTHIFTFLPDLAYFVQRALFSSYNCEIFRQGRSNRPAQPAHGLAWILK